MDMSQSAATAVRKGKAKASLILGIVGLPTLGLLFVGGITGLLFGLTAWRKVDNDPLHYGGRGLAIAGIITNVLSLILAIPAADFINSSLQHYLKSGRETAAIQSLRRIHESQAQYNVTKGRFGTLKELVEDDLLDKSYTSGKPISGYIYTDSEVSADTYCVHADREKNEIGERDFNITETGVVHYIKSDTKGTIPRGQGSPWN